MKSSRLRVFKTREQNIETHADLRGLGDEPLLQRSTPTASLIVRYEKESLEVLEKVQRKYSLSVEEDKKAQAWILSTSAGNTRPHKEQSVILFFAGMSLVTTSPRITAVLIETNHLYAELRSSTLGEHTNSVDLQGLAKAVSGLHLAPAITYHLNQSGFPIEASPSTRILQSKELQEIESFILSAQGGLNERKAG
jgi:hypothetical protein